MKTNGFVFSIDVLLSLLVFFSFFSLVLFFFNQTGFSAKNSVLLKQTAMDVLTVLERKGILEQAVKGNDLRLVRSYVNSLPVSVCVDVAFFSQGNLNEPLLSFVRNDCRNVFGESATFSNSFVVRNGLSAGFFLARVIVWNRVE